MTFRSSTPFESTLDRIDPIRFREVPHRVCQRRQEDKGPPTMNYGHGA